MYQTPPPVDLRKVEEQEWLSCRRCTLKHASSSFTWYKMKIKTSVFPIQGEELKIQTEIMNNNVFLQYKRWMET